MLFSPSLMQHQLWNLAQRTTALPFGRGAFTLATTYTLLTEACKIYFTYLKKKLWINVAEI